MDLKSRYRGLLIGTAAGDSLGLPAEGLSRSRVGRMFAGRWRHRFLPGLGMISDDTEHSFFVVQSLLAQPDSCDGFARRLGWCLKWWFASLPAGIGMATAKSCIRLWLGFSAGRSGVSSAGNGPAMRVAPLGAFFHSSPGELAVFTRACTVVSHTDPRALTGAMAVAAVAAWIVRQDMTSRPAAGEFISLLRAIEPADQAWLDIVCQMEASLARGESVDGFVRVMGFEQRVSGYIYQTVPVALYAWHRHFGDFEATLSSVFACGGDTDTVGAVAGGLAGLSVGEGGIPSDWIAGIADWPRGVALMRAAAERLAVLRETGVSGGPVKYFSPGLIVRNALFFAIVLAHGIRRLLPPY